MDDLFLEQWKEEREEAKAFREDVISRLSSVETYMSNQEAVKTARDRLLKVIAWAVGVSLTVAGLVLPIVLR